MAGDEVEGVMNREGAKGTKKRIYLRRVDAGDKNFAAWRGSGVIPVWIA